MGRKPRRKWFSPELPEVKLDSGLPNFLQLRPPNPLLFELLPLRFSFVAHQALYFPAGKTANLLRGALGTILRTTACAPDCPGARLCPVRAECPYARLFEPAAFAGGPSGLADWPRPFVFRARHLDGGAIAPGSTFFFDIHLFDTHSKAAAALQDTFAELGQQGLGPDRARAELTGVQRLDDTGGTHPFSSQTEPLRIDLNPGEAPVRRIVVQFLTPTELKGQNAIPGQPSFGVLAARIRDRVSTLRECYGSGPLEIDFQAFGERAARIATTRCELTQVNVERRSSRTGQVHSIGGFVGEAEYAGELKEFIPYLRAAQWTGVGRQTVWGKGEIQYREL